MKALNIFEMFFFFERKSYDVSVDTFIALSWFRLLSHFYKSAVKKGKGKKCKCLLGMTQLVRLSVDNSLLSAVSERERD
jgi:hypothetical protein